MRSLPAFPSFPALFRVLLALFVAAVVAGCGTTGTYDETAGWSAGKLYSEAKDAQSEGSWEKAAKFLEKLEARFP